MPVTIQSVSDSLRQYYPELKGLYCYQQSCDLTGSYLGVEFTIDIFSINGGRPDWHEYLYPTVAQKLDKIKAEQHASV